MSAQRFQLIFKFLPTHAFKVAGSLLFGIFFSMLAVSDETVFNYEAAMASVNFNINNDSNGAQGENGIPEGVEMALVAAILANDELDLSDNGGVTHGVVYQAYLQVIKNAKQDASALLSSWPLTPDVIAAYALLGKDSFNAINRMTTGFNAPLISDYSIALALDKFLSASGDADGDGFTNLQEYHASGKANYVSAALDPDSKPSAKQLADMPKPKKTRLTLGIVLYPGFEVLDVYGPLEMWGYVPEFEIVLIAEKSGPVRSAQGPATVANYSFDDAPPLDILMVPGGNGTRAELNNETLLNYLIKANQQTEYTTSVCTGSALLAKAGVLDGHRATSNKRFFSLAELQSDKVDWVVDARWVESGKMFTSSGVSAGTDMALGLVAKIHGIEAARELASAVEYTWHEDADDDPFAKYVDRLVVSAASDTQLVKSEPLADSSLNRSPRFLRLYFNNPPAVESSELRLYPVNDKEQSIAMSGLHTMGANDLMIGIDETLADGVYVLEWTTGFATGDKKLADKLQFRVQTATP